MCFEIVYKWTIPLVGNQYPPMIINLTIDNFLGFGKIVAYLYFRKACLSTTRTSRRASSSYS